MPADDRAPTGRSSARAPTGAVWLDAERTSPYAFYQYWMNVDDRDVERFLLQLTLLPVDEVAGSWPRPTPRPRSAGTASGGWPARSPPWCTARPRPRAAAAASRVLFGGDPSDGRRRRRSPCWPPSCPTAATGGATPSAGLEPRRPGRRARGLASSRSDARRGLDAGELYVNGAPVGGGRPASRPTDLLHDRYLLVRRGKKRYASCVDRA